jgi:RNA polymerase sigma-70 factor (ECF subfamily)
MKGPEFLMAFTTSAQQILRDGRMQPGERNDIPEQYWEVIERYRQSLLDQAAQILGGREDAEDVVQETFYEAIRHSEKLNQADSIGAWLSTINRGNALNKLRSRKSRRMQAASAKALPEDTFTTGGFSALELRDSMNRALAALPADLHSIVKLRYFEHLSYKEIADRLQLQVGAVQRRLVQASALLYGQLKSHLGSAPPKIFEDTDTRPEQGVSEQ